MQGKQRVLIEYGVADMETAQQEKEFIYGRNRLNVAITRAKSKSIVFLSRELLQGSPAILSSDEAALGLRYMQRLEAWTAEGEKQCFVLENDQRLTIFRRGH